MEIKGGHKTSECFMAIGTILSVIISRYIGIELSAMDLAAITGAASSFIVSRGMAKKGA